MKKKIYIIPGWTYSTKKWDKLIQALSEKNYSCKILRVPGLQTKLDKAYSIDDYVNWLDSKLKGLKDINLITHSNGSRIAINYLAQNPEKNIRKLVLISPAGVKRNEPLYLLKTNSFKLIAKVAKLFTNSPTLKKTIYKLAGSSDYNNASENMKKTMLNMINQDIQSLLDKVNVPTLIIWGEKDKTTPLKQANIFHNKIKNSKLFIVKNATHSSQFEKPKLVADKISKFL